MIRLECSGSVVQDSLEGPPIYLLQVLKPEDPGLLGLLPPSIEGSIASRQRPAGPIPGTLWPLAVCPHLDLLGNIPDNDYLSSEH